MSANSEKVIQIIRKALQDNAGESAGCDRNWAAAYTLYERRNDPNNPKASLDEDLAAAEHYLVARAYVSCGIYSVNQMKEMIMIYYGVKKIVPEKWIRHNPGKPATPASHDQIIWGFVGANDGEKERKRYAPTKKPPLYKKPADFIGKHGK